MVVFAAALAALFCFLGISALFIYRITTVVPSRGGEYMEGMVSQPSFVNPVLASTEADKLLVRLLFSNIPDVAEKVEVDKGGRVWQVTLKENVLWSDDYKLTSDDIVFTVEKIQDPQAQSPFFHSWQGVAVNRLSELKVQFNLVSPYPFFEENLRGLYILPKHIFADTPPANWKLSKYNLEPIGSGPYRFLSYAKQPSGFITHFRMIAQNGRVESPLIEKFDLRFFPHPEEMIEEFNAGKIDGLTTMDGELYAKATRPHQLFSYYLPSYYAVFFNQSQNIALQDGAVRKALTEAVDPAALAEKIFSGRANSAYSPVSELPLSPSRPNISLAETISKLEQAGWVKNSEGIREKSDRSGNLPLVLRLTVPDVPFLIKTAGELKESWVALGAR
ncbi:MAG: ABC transporter substrate-binding protein, partial [Candidatus Liptonbacteria bacterium]